MQQHGHVILLVMSTPDSTILSEYSEHTPHTNHILCTRKHKNTSPCDAADGTEILSLSPLCIRLYPQQVHTMVTATEHQTGKGPGNELSMIEVLGSTSKMTLETAIYTYILLSPIAEVPLHSPAEYLTSHEMYKIRYMRYAARMARSPAERKGPNPKRPRTKRPIQHVNEGKNW